MKYLVLLILLSTVGCVTDTPPPEFTLTLDAIIFPDSLDAVFGDIPELWGHSTSTVGWTPGFVIISGKCPDLDITDTSSYFGSRVGGQPNKKYTEPNFRTGLSIFDLLKGCMAGDTVYFRGYPMKEHFKKTESINGKNVFTGLGKGSNVLSMIWQ